MTRRLALSTLTIAVLVCVVASGFSSAQSVTITVWDAIPELGRHVFLDLIKEFEAENPDIRVEAELVPGGYSAIYEKLTVGLLGNVTPNIVHLGVTSSYNLRYQGVFAELNDYIAEDDSFDLSDWNPAFLETVMIEDKIYGIPYNASTPIMYYNPYVFQSSGLEVRPPATWDEMVAMGRRITRDTTGDGRPDIWATDNIRNPNWLFQAFVGQAGGRMINADRTEFVFNSPEAVRAFEFQQDLIHAHGVAHYPGLSAEEIYRGNVAWAIRSTADLRGWLETSAERGMPLSAAPLACDVQCSVPIGGGSLFVLDKGTEAEIEASYRLLSFLGRPENLARYAAATGYMVGRRSAVNTEYLQNVIADHPEFLVSYRQLEVGQPEIQAPEFGNVKSLILANRPNFLDPIYQDNMPVKPVLDDAVRKANAMLNEFYATVSRP